ncbi:MAG: hypothetical protein BGO98_11550 [Myxococcales bacterium 68-20]|nr:MAG: hypothetical protein BGO98_11550 [Myxococcales bacterium 68-20]
MRGERPRYVRTTVRPLVEGGTAARSSNGTATASSTSDATAPTDFLGYFFGQLCSASSFTS